MDLPRPLAPRRVLAVTAAIAALLAGPALAASPYTPESQDMTMGDQTAPVTVVEYASASCPHCARFNNDVFPAFKKKYIDTGKVRYVFRELLTAPTNVAAAGFIVARCAGPDHYFQILDAFFHGQTKMYQTGDVLAALTQAGAAGGLSKAQVQACTSDVNAIDAANERSAINGTEHGVNWHPDLRHQRQTDAADDSRGGPSRPGRGDRPAVVREREALAPVHFQRLRISGFKSFVDPTEVPHRAGRHRRGGAQRLRQVQHPGIPALGDGRQLRQGHARLGAWTTLSSPAPRAGRRATTPKWC